MLFNVPQFIDIEDKIVGPLTAKQLGWMALGVVIILFLYATLATVAFYIAAFFVAAIVGALAFYRPYNQPLISFILSSVYYLFRPRIYVWKRLPEAIKVVAKSSEKEKEAREKKKISGEKLEEISRILDQHK